MWGVCFQVRSQDLRVNYTNSKCLFQRRRHYFHVCLSISYFIHTYILCSLTLLIQICIMEILLQN